MDCVDVCPVDCFYEGENMLVIHPDECIDCGVCVPECPVDAIKPDTEPGLEKWLSLNGEYAHSRASKLSSFTHRPQTGNCRRKLTASSGASGFAISARRLPLFRRLVNSRKPKAIIRISALVGAMRRSLCRPRRSRDCMRTTSSWPPRLTAYSLARPRSERILVVLGSMALRFSFPMSVCYPGQ